MKIVITFGTFDIFHKGHESYLTQARAHGDYLIVVVARDETVEKVKGKLPDNNEHERLQRVKDSGLANEVLLGNTGEAVNKYQMIQDYRPDVVCLGYDQASFIDKLHEKLQEFGLDQTQVVRLQPFKPEIYKSSKLRNKHGAATRSCNFRSNQQ